MTDEQEFLVYQNAVMASLNDSWKKLKLCVTNHLRASQGQTPPNVSLGDGRIEQHGGY